MAEQATAIIGSLLAQLPDASAGEAIEALWSRPGVRVERIVSRGQASPPGFWYDQAHLEIVLVVTGRARLRLADAPGEAALAPGDYAVLPPHCRHRVEWTAPDEDTVWLAVHIGQDGD
jgi:cupin 2 domain-containing protein